MAQPPAPVVTGVPPAPAQPLPPDDAEVQAELVQQRPLWNRLFDRNRPVSVPDVARAIDALDHQLSEIGVVDVKAADVWGQNRMTKFRVEYEQEMVKNLPNFRAVLSARQRQADEATLTSATSIGMVRGGSQQVSGGSTVTNVAVPTPSQGLVAVSPLLPTETPVIGTPASTTSPVPATGVALGLAGTLPGVSTSTATSELIGLEPTILLDEQSRFLLHLQELRRINTGDDTADMPGYGLYLLRMPVSLLPGDKTFKGKGASVTVQASHALPPDLLPTTFRDFVTNDLAAVLAPFIEQLLDDDEIRPLTPDIMREQLRQAYPHLFVATPVPQVRRGQQQTPGASATVVQARFAPTPGTSATQTTTSSAPMLRALSRIQHPSVPPSAGPSTTKATPSSEVAQVYGPLLYALAADVKEAKGQFHGHDFSTRDWLILETKGAYAYILSNRDDPHFSTERTEAIGRLVETRSYNQLAVERDNWLITLPGYGQPPQDPPNNGPRPIEGLSYGVIVECYLLDRQLKADMASVSLGKGGACGNPADECFYALNPSLRARALYNAYVEAKWPVRVFAIDPVVDQQNVEDVSSLRRELQIALAVGVSRAK